MMRRAGNWLAATRLTWLLVLGLLAVYAGERLVPQLAAARWVLTAGGSALVLAVTGLRLVGWRKAGAGERRLALLLFLATAGCALALLGFLLVGPLGRALGIVGDGDGRRVQTALLVLSSILLAVSLLPLLAAQWALRLDRQRAGVGGALDRLRAGQLAAAGATVALAGAFLMLLGYVASARDVMVDVSYFKTASPGSAATRITKSMGSPLRVMLFFPPVNQVGDQVLGYFRALERQSGNARIETHDRLASPALAEQYHVTDDGTIVLASGDRVDVLRLPVTLGEARPRLRELDRLVQGSLMRVARATRTVYFTSGHGELNEQQAMVGDSALPYGGLEVFRSLFATLNYQVDNLGVQNGLGQAVPADAAMVLVLGPRRPFLDAELAALDRYLAGGGAVLLALEPGTDFVLGPLEQRLGVVFHNVPVADDVQHLRFRGNESDRQLIVTDRFSSHAAVSTLSQAGLGAGIALLGAGYLTTNLPGSRASIVVYALPSTGADANRDFRPDSSREGADPLALVAAVEGARPAAAPAPTAAPGDSAPGDSPAAGDAGRPMRAMVFADADLFADGVVTSLGLNAALASDAVRWLGQEEELAGETRSEEDVAVVHTRAEDVGWFYATIFGVPALVLGLGLFGVRRRRRENGAGRES